MNAITCEVKRYEMSGNGGLRLVDPKAGAGLEVGRVLHWGGNMGAPARDVVIVGNQQSTFGGHYKVFDLDNPEENAHLHGVEFHSVKREDDPSLWHRQHYFVTDRILPADEVSRLMEMHREQAAAKEERERAAAEEWARMEAEGRELWARLMPTGVEHVIVAERMKDESDIMTDYFNKSVSETIILAPSNTKKNSFAEMRKAASLIPETEHLGPGCDDWRITLLDDNKGGYISYRGTLEDKATGRRSFRTEADARAVLEAAEASDRANREAVPFVPFCPKVPFGAEVRRESIEHRENYSGGSGYYLESHSSVWRVRKTYCTNSNKEVRSELLIALVRRHDHLEKAATEAKAPRNSLQLAADAVAGVEVRENEEKGGIEIRFAERPSKRILDGLKAAGWRWSKFAGCWYTKASDGARAFAAGICGEQTEEATT